MIIDRKSKAAPNKEETSTLWLDSLEGGRGRIYEGVLGKINKHLLQLRGIAEKSSSSLINLSNNTYKCSASEKYLHPRCVFLFFFFPKMVI